MKQKLFLETNNENGKPDKTDKVKWENTNHLIRNLKGYMTTISKDVKKIIRQL